MLKKLTIISFLSLATLPLFQEHHNSWIIISCLILTLVNLLKSNKKIALNSSFLLLISPFFFVFLVQLLNSTFSLKTVLLNLPFVALPIIFANRPDYINERIKNKSLLIFQISVCVQAVLFFWVFLKNNALSTLFQVSQENIPFFREFVFEHSWVKIHPTYFSAFLLVSVTISLSYINKSRVFHILNFVFCIFFLILFSSRIIILIFFATIGSFILYQFFSNQLSKKMKLGLVLLTFIVMIAFLKSDIVYERFEEIRTEISKPIVGNYYNTTNTRITIWKCDWELIKKAPFFGFGNDLQNQLNQCFASITKSDFYKMNTYNTHNFYIHIVLFGGWLLLLFFLIYFFVVFKWIRYSKLAIILFVQILLINLTENFLWRHYGLVLFTYFTALFVYIDEKRISKPESISTT